MAHSQMDNLGDVYGKLMLEKARAMRGDMAIVEVLHWLEMAEMADDNHTAAFCLSSAMRVCNLHIEDMRQHRNTNDNGTLVHN